MSIDKNQFKSLIKDTLEKIELNSPSAVELLMLTAAQESHFGTYIKQIGGPALGVFQMEPNTYEDLWKNYLIYRKELGRKINFASSNSNVMLNQETIMFNLAYAICMARVHYLRVPAPLPAADDIHGLAEYWKEHYNTPLGAGTVKEAVKNYERFCL